MSSFKITCATEVLTSYVQAEAIAPDSKFQAVQTPDGHSLLFSIGTDKILYLMEEFLGEKTGWLKNDISTVEADKFPPTANKSVKTFAVDQIQTDQTTQTSKGFCLLMVLTVDGVDHLYMASNYTRDENQGVHMQWTEIPYDNPTALTGSLSISDIYLMDVSTEPLIVVDIKRADGDIGRYYIDTKHKYQKYTWIYYNLPADMEPNSEQTPVKVCCGRRAEDQYVNGLYTKGVVAGSATIMYQPLYSISNPSQPGDVSNLLLPPGVYPTDIVTVDSIGTPPIAGNYPATFTDLFATATDGGLYFFSAAKQQHRSTGVLIMKNDLFLNMRQLFAIRTDEKVVIWGRGGNAGQQIFYTQCAISNNSFSGDWTIPMPIAADVYQISPYINRVNGGKG